MVQSGDPQTTDIHYLSVPADAAGESSPVITELFLLGCPDVANVQLELLSIHYRANVLMIDTTDCHVDIEFIDDSDSSDAVTKLVTDFDMEVANCEAFVMNLVWSGSKILDPGDVINAEFDVTSPSTISKGAGFLVEYRVLRHS